MCVIVFQTVTDEVKLIETDASINRGIQKSVKNLAAEELLNLVITNKYEELCVKRPLIYITIILGTIPPMLFGWGGASLLPKSNWKLHEDSLTLNL